MVHDEPLLISVIFNQLLKRILRYALISLVHSALHMSSPIASAVCTIVPKRWSTSSSCGQ